MSSGKTQLKCCKSVINSGLRAVSFVKYTESPFVAEVCKNR